MEEKFEVRDLRNGEWAWVHKTIIEYGGFKASTKLIYLALAYLANQKSQSCYPSISYLKKITRLSKPTIIKGLSELEEAKVLKIERRSGQYSIYTLLKTNQLKNLTGKKYDRPVKNRSTNNNKEQELNNNISKEIVKPAFYGNEDINYLIALLKEKTSLNKLDGTEKQNRRYCWLALKKFGGRQKVELLIKMALRSDFHRKNLTSFKYLYYNGVKILVEFKEDMEHPRVAKIR